MKTSSSLLILAAALSVALVASQGCSSGSPGNCTTCGDGGKPDSGSVTGDAGNPLATTCADFNAALCAFLFRCGDVASEAECNARSVPASTCLFPQKQAIRHGRAAYDAQGTAACLSALRTSAACTLPSAGLGGYPGCPAYDRGFITGLVADNGVCFSSSECGANSYCTSDGPTGTCPGLCVPRNGAGAQVQFSAQCQAGLYDYSGACAAFAADNASCAATAGANGPQTCMAGDFCDPSAATCMGLHGSGQSCTTQDQCNGLLVCDGAACQPLATVNAPCGPVAKRACERDLTCLPQYVDGGNPTCKTVGPSNPCKQSDDCGPGYTCSGASAGSFGSCVTLTAAGGACTTSSQCQPEFFCDSTQHCAVKADPNQACDVNAAGSCKLGTCVSDGGAGTSCEPTLCGDFAP